MLARLCFTLTCAMAALPLASHAAAVLESVVGDVRIVLAEGAKPLAVKQGFKVGSRTTLITGADGLAILVFDDAQKLMLAPNSELDIVDTHYRENAASADRAEFALKRGALRTVSGLIARRNAEMFVVRTPHVNLGVRGTDFSVTLIGQSFWSVNEGAVLATTNAGKGVFGKGSFGRAASLERLAAGVPSAGLPVAVLALFNELNAPKVTAQLAPAPGGAMAAAAPAAEPAPTSPGLGAAGMMGVLAAVAAALAAAGGGGGDTPAAVRH